ncbi:virulence factor TspB C-terminal domain-related protein, partial [Vibrio sp. 10N.286.49.E1]|uniref:virulence factor TspB C-terminal domain-related protein n=1 Tax=Vibrio sp. 10N.286.49.E1 TaxID=3229702 RepID=UPI00354AD691
VHNRLDAVNDNLAGANERIETINDLLTDFANSFDKSTDKSNKALGDINDQLTKNGKQVSDGLDAANNFLGDIADGSNTDVGESGCDVGSFTCTGNTYECFVARSAWKNNCLISSLTSDINTGEGVPVDTNKSVYDSGDSLINDLKSYTATNGNVEKLSNGEISLSDTLSKYNESNGFNFDDRCPSPTQVNYGLGSFELNYQPFCDLALYIRAMLMLTASIGSVLMIAKHS